MTSISGYGAPPSPLARLQSRLSADISAGSIKSSDKDALSAALDSIDASLKSARAQQTDSGRPSKDAMQAKIDGLIGDQVKAGSLTEDQAAELKQLFSETFSAHGAHRAHHAPPPPPDDAAGQDDTQTASATTSSSSSTSNLGSDVSEVLQKFLDLLKSSASANASYSASGAANGAKSLSLLINITT